MKKLTNSPTISFKTRRRKPKKKRKNSVRRLLNTCLELLPKLSNKKI
jgi:hypothetical protein